MSSTLTLATCRGVLLPTLHQRSPPFITLKCRRGSYDAGNWERVSSYLAKNNALEFETMAVFLTDARSAATPELGNTVTSGSRERAAPFSMNQISLAMLRILEKKDHEGTTRCAF